MDASRAGEGAAAESAGSMAAKAEMSASAADMDDLFICGIPW
jgi:hypothetical protein